LWDKVGAGAIVKSLSWSIPVQDKKLPVTENVAAFFHEGAI
jgi:hypothetical protein